MYDPNLRRGGPQPRPPMGGHPGQPHMMMQAGYMHHPMQHQVSACAAIPGRTRPTCLWLEW